MTRDVLLGFDFGGTKIAVVLATPDGKPAAMEVLSTDAAAGAEQALRRALGTARELLEKDGGSVAAVGVSTMGITFEDGVGLAPNVPGWSTLRLPATFRAAFAPAPVTIDNDVKAAALAEMMWGELRGVDTGIYLNLGTGIAAALVVGGAVVQGAHGAAGEIGYVTRSRIDGPGARDGRAPLEEYVGGVGVVARARELGAENGVADLVSRDDPAARDFLADLYAEIAWHVTNLAIAVDPERVVVGGGYARSSEQLLAELRDRLDRYVPYPPELRLARFGADSGAMGAIALALRGRPAT